MHIIQKLRITPRLEVRPVVKEGQNGQTIKTVIGKQQGAYDRFNYNVNNDILNKPASYNDTDKKELEKIKQELADDLGVGVDKLIAKNKLGLLSGPSRVRIRISNAGLSLKPMENPEDIIKALILLSNSSIIAFGIDDMKNKPSCTYVLTEPEDVVNDSSNEFVVIKDLMQALAVKTNTNEDKQIALELLSFKNGSNNRMSKDASELVLNSKLNDTLKDINESKKLIAILNDDDFRVHVKVVRFIYDDVITYRASEGYSMPNTEYRAANYTELYAYLNSNPALFGALTELDISKKSKVKRSK